MNFRMYSTNSLVQLPCAHFQPLYPIVGKKTLISECQYVVKSCIEERWTGANVDSCTYRIVVGKEVRILGGFVRGLCLC